MGRSVATYSPFHPFCLFIDYWGEPERAPHRRVCCKFSIYVCRTGKRGILGHFMIFRKNDLKLDS